MLDEYGVVDPGEFFAAATECFFEQSKRLQQVCPRLYDELRRLNERSPAAFDQMPVNSGKVKGAFE